MYDRNKILKHNEGTKRICENCNQECLATLYCELCVRNYLKANFSNWTSGNDDIDNLIYATNNRAANLIDYNIHNDMHKRHEFVRQTVLADKSLTNDEKTEAIKILNQNYDRNKVMHNELLQPPHYIVNFVFEII